MLTLAAMLKAMRQKAEYGELDLAVPRDHAPASYYAERRLRERADGSGEVQAPDAHRAEEGAKPKRENPEILG